MTATSTWTRSTLGEVARWGSGGTPRAGASNLYGGSIPWAVIGDLKDGPLARTSQSITEAGLAASSAKWVPAGAVLIAMYGSIGKLALAQIPMTTNQAIAHAVPHAHLDARFLFYYLMEQREALNRAGQGATQRNIGQGTLKSWPIRYPALYEQHRIVELIEGILSRLDAADASLTLATRRTDRLGDSVIASRLAAVDAPAQPLAGLLACPLSNGKSVPTQAGGFPVLRLTALRSGRVDLTERKEGRWTAEAARRWLVRRGDFLVARGNGSLNLVGRGALVADDPDPVAFPDTLIRVRPDTSKVIPEFLNAVWNSRIVRGQIEGLVRTTAGIYKINQKAMGGVNLPVPRLDDQRRIVTAIAEQKSATEQLENNVEACRSGTAALRRAVLETAFAGRLTGSNVTGTHPPEHARP